MAMNRYCRRNIGFWAESGQLGGTAGMDRQFRGCEVDRNAQGSAAGRFLKVG
jgi:hypothetical protein